MVYITPLKDHPANPKVTSVRVFFALFPDEATQTRLAQQAKKLAAICGGRAIKSAQIHLTLVFLGNIDIHRIEDLKQTMQTITAKPFELLFDTICYWKRNHIVSVQVSQLPSELLLLVTIIETTLSTTGFNYDKRSYKPHITLIRNAMRPPTTNIIEPISLYATEWLLVQSKPVQNHIDYIPLAKWSLP